MVSPKMSLSLFIVSIKCIPILALIYTYVNINFHQYLFFIFLRNIKKKYVFKKTLNYWWNSWSKREILFIISKYSSIPKFFMAIYYFILIYYTKILFQKQCFHISGGRRWKLYVPYCAIFQFWYCQSFVHHFCRNVLLIQPFVHHSLGNYTKTNKSLYIEFETFLDINFYFFYSVFKCFLVLK